MNKIFILIITVLTIFIAAYGCSNAVGSDDSTTPPTLYRLQGQQCKDICEIAGACMVDGVPQDIMCNMGTKRTNCCEYFGLQ